MKKYATSVILQGYSSSRSGRTSAQRAPSPRTDAPVVAPTRNRVVVDSNRGFPSPKIAHAPGIRNRRSPFPDYHEENQTWVRAFIVLQWLRQLFASIYFISYSCHCLELTIINQRIQSNNLCWRVS